MEGAKKETRQKEDISSFSTLLQKDTRRFDNEVKKAGIQQARKNLCIFFTRKKKEEKKSTHIVAYCLYAVFTWHKNKT